MLLFLIYVFMAIGSYIVFYRRTLDTLNPFGIMLGIFLLGAGGTCLKLNDYHVDLSMVTHIIIIMVSLEVFVVGLIFTNSMLKNTKYTIPTTTSNYSLYMWVIVLCIVLFVGALWLSTGSYISEFSSENFDQKTSASIDFQGGTGSRYSSYILNVFPYTALFVFFDLTFNARNSRFSKGIEICYIVVVCLFSWFVLVSRGTLLILVLGMLYIYNSKRRIKLKMLCVLLLVIIVGFALLMTLRVNTASIVYDGKTDNIYFNTIYNYFTINYQILDRLVVQGPEYTWIKATWVSISKLLGVYDQSEMNMILIGPYNSRTALYNFYHDLGFLGILIYPILIFSVIGYMYEHSRNDKPHYVLIIAVLQKAIYMFFYGNYFFGVLGIEIPYIITLLLVWLAYNTTTIVITFGNKTIRRKFGVKSR